MELQNSYLIRRYLIWCYKTTKEDLDRIDRYFTQALVDDFISEKLKDADEYSDDEANQKYVAMVKSFDEYKQVKLEKASQKKFLDENQEIHQPEYQYLVNRLAAIENSIIEFLDEETLQEIQELYEQEMTERILSARDHS